MEGWVSIHRKMSENDLWTCETFSRGQAWIDLIMLASHKESYFYKRGVKIDIQRGELAWSEVALSERWKWSRSKVKKFLKDLEKEQQIEQQKTNITTKLRLINYDKYQTKEQQTEQQKSSKRAAKEQQKDTYNNVNNDNNVNNTLEGRKKNFATQVKQFLNKYDKEMLKAFYEYWSEHGPNDKKMRFEKQTSFGISRRLATWKSKEKDFVKPINGNNQEPSGIHATKKINWL